MTVQDPFATYARGLVPQQKTVDPDVLRQAQEWYKTFAGTHAVKMEDRELVEIYEGLH